MLTQPSSLEQAKLAASRLCRFLAELPLEDWDRSSEPDLRLLLTEKAITRFSASLSASGLKPNARSGYSTMLTAVAKAVGTIAVPVRRPRAVPSEAHRAIWAAAAGLSPYPVVAEACRLAGAPVLATSWTVLRDESAFTDHAVAVGAVTWRATAGPWAPGTLAAVRASEALRDASSPSGLVSSPVRGTTSPIAVTRRPSRAAAMREARKAAAQATTPAPEMAEIPALPEDLAGMVDGWRPQGVPSVRWEPVREAFAIAVSAHAPASASSMRNCRPMLAAFCLWTYESPTRQSSGDLDAAELLAEGLVDRYVSTALMGKPDASRATHRSVLRGAVSKLSPGPAAEKIAYQPVQPPYSETECARFVTLARQQPNVALRRSLSAMVALGLGAGLGAEDQRQIAPCHVIEVDLGEAGTALAVNVPGPRTRIVVVREQFEDLLRDALQLHTSARRGASTPLCGVKPDRKNGANRVASRAVTATGTGVDINAARLRATWLVACMSSRVLLGALLHAAGLKSPRTLTDLLPHCPEPDPDEVAAALRALTTPRSPSTSAAPGGDEPGDVP